MVAFRLDAHRLGEGLEAGSLLQVAGSCGLQDSPPGSVLMALHARAADIAPNAITSAVASTGTCGEVLSHSSVQCGATLLCRRWQV